MREMIPLWLGSGGEICGYPSVRPGAGPDQKFELFEFRPMIRDRVESLSVIVWSNYNDVVATWSKRTKVGKKSVFPNEIFGCQIGSY